MNVKINCLIIMLFDQIWGFQGGRSQIYKAISIYRRLVDIKILDSMLFMAFRNGDTQIFTWEEEEKELYKINCDKQDEHEDELMSIDML